KQFGFTSQNMKHCDDFKKIRICKKNPPKDYSYVLKKTVNAAGYFMNKLKKEESAIRARLNAPDLSREETEKLMQRQIEIQKLIKG
ncbi:MAG: hypothetical protein ACSW8G_03595, partial [Bacillota bacterium]